MLHSGAFQLDVLINSFFCNLTFCSLLSLMYWSIWIPVTFSPSAACLPQDLSLPDWSLTQPSAPHIWTRKIHWKLDKTLQIMFWKAFLGLWTYFTAFSSIRRTLLARSPTWNGLQLDLYSTFWLLSGVEETRTVVWDKFFSSVRSSNSHPDLLVTHQHPPHFFR